jgi:hypothetical protein
LAQLLNEKAVTDALAEGALSNHANSGVILGRATAGVGPVEELTLSQALDLIGSAAQGDLLFRGASGWQRLAAGTSGQFLKTLGAGADPAWATASGGGSGTWTLTTTPISSAVSSVDFTGLSGTDFIIICRGVTQSASGVLISIVSTDGGANWYTTAGDYVALSTAGTETSSANGPAFFNTNTTSAKSGTVRMIGAGVNGVAKPMTCDVLTTETRLFVGSTSPITGIRVKSSNGSANLTGGTIYLLSR